MLPGRSKAPAERYRILCGTCPDKSCKTKLYFPSYDTSIECSNCGQRHPRSAMGDTEEVTDPEVALHNMVRNLLVGNFTPKKTADSIKVLGLSNYHCKLLSPLLTYYGMDKQNKARPLREVNQKDVFNCSVLGSRAFLIQPEHIGIMGYGRDQTGSAKYLSQTLQMIYNFHDGQEVLIPIHADGDGHCLVHGISRALVGRELFWHALRTNLKTHFLDNLERYKNLFCDFVDAKEWEIIIAESDPDYLPGPNEAFGLQNIHIFGLANVLHRPIILLDSLSGLQSSGDYTGVFLPGLVPPEQCRGKDGKFNKPLCVAWSSSGRNHFIALVGVKGRPLPRLPRWMLTKAWGVPHDLIPSYIEFDQDDMCVVGGDRSLQDKYIQRLATAMEEVFLDKYGVHPSVVADVHHYIYKQKGVVGVQQDIIIDNTRRTVQDNQLYRCLMCKAVSQIVSHRIAPERLGPGGDLYEEAKNLYVTLDPTKLYSIPAEDINCTYDPVKDVLVVNPRPQSSQCAWCQGKYLRLLSADGSVSYLNGDRTASPAPKSKCNCGYKHYWDGKEYDNHPSIFPVKMTWKGETVTEDVVWFQNETVSHLNSNAFEVASALVQKYFPGEFGSEKLVQEVVATILQNTAKAEATYEPISLKEMPTEQGEPSSSTGGHTTTVKEKAIKDDVNKHVAAKKGGSPREKGASPPGGQIPSKIILTGYASKTLHKEELTMSQAERNLKKRIEQTAPVRQQRQKSAENAMKTESKGSNQTAKISTADSGQGSVAGGSVEGSPEPERNTAPPRVKKIRVSTSDGRQATIVLETSLTYSQLQARIETELEIPAIQQRIRCGFPPKELRRPEEGQENDPLPLQNGDKVMVEMLPDPNRPKESRMDTGPSYGKGSGVGSSITEQNSAADIAMASEIMKNLERIQQGNNASDELDMQLNTLPLLATLTGLDLWKYAQRNSHLFENGGLYYRIVQRDLGLVDGKHCTLPNLTDKKFYYNGTDDRLELCLEPLGHFPVMVGIDDPQKLSELAAGQSTSRSSHESEEVIGRGSLSAGGSGVVKHSHQKKDTYVAFGGAAHTLSSAATAREPDVRPKVRSESIQSRYDQNEISKSTHNTTGDSSGGLGLSDIRQSHSVDGNQGDIMRDTTAMETDAGAIISRYMISDNESGPSSPMEVDQSREFPTTGASNQLLGGGMPSEQSAGVSSFVGSDTRNTAARSELEQESDTAIENPVYISKKLGPGYTVLMKQPAPGSSHSTEQGEDADGGDT